MQKDAEEYLFITCAAIKLFNVLQYLKGSGAIFDIGK
jgi:hypothetical protein